MAAPRAEELLAGAEPVALPTRSVVVHKELELDFDLGNLLARDANPPPRAAAAQRETALRALARDNAQLLAADPLEDQLGRQRREKRERVARNELNRLRNLARASSFHPTGHQGRQELGRAACLARASTASLGRFQPRLPRESPLPPPRSTGSGKKKRRFAPLLGDLAAERGRQLELVRTLAKPLPLDVARATNKQLRQEDAEAASTGRAKGRKRSERGKRARGRGIPQQRRRGQQKQQRPAGGKRRKH
ncbi:PREDICTED: ribosome biogenesis regulatory protein homolog [Gavialis gangeticus]|uniref:ribosome biogenesis regulatory protein homolog n=1 Tax=Gavialis gangeticus TaxID=94835 RepID=UPI00092EC301|nr:PREDICTED: ribosome biogenesis regulatory protein homolog [Gavialis gangeticus]